MRFYLARHASTQGNIDGILYGATDLDLTERGVEEALEMADLLRDLAVGAVYSSDSLRTIRTARMAFPRREPIVRRDLRCLDFGELEGRTYSEVRRDHPGLAETWEKDLPSLAFPGGESMVGFQARVTRAWHEILSLHAGAGDDVALVLHGGPLRIIIFDILGIPLKNFYKLHVPTASVSIVEAASDFCTVVSLGVRAPGQLPH